MAVFKNDIGTIIRVDTGFDLTTATRRDLVVYKPSGVEVTWTGVLSTMSNTQIDYTVIANDLDEIGDYLIQAYVELPFWSGRGKTTTLSVTDYFK